MENSKGMRIRIKEGSEIYRKISEGNSVARELYSVLNGERQYFIKYTGDYIDIIKFFGEINGEDKNKIKKILSNTIESADQIDVKIQGIKFHTIQKIDENKGKQVDHYLEKMFSKDGKLMDGVNFSVTENEIYFINKNGISKNSIDIIYSIIKKLGGHKKVDITHVNGDEIIEITVIQDLFKYENTAPKRFY